MVYIRQCSASDDQIKHPRLEGKQFLIPNWV